MSPALFASERVLLLFLRGIGAITLLAFAAAVMPSSWMIEIADELQVGPLPDVPLTFYLARNLSVLYGFVGVAMLVIASDLTRYRPLVRYLWMGTLLLGGFQLIVDAMAGMPWWWTLGESGSTIAGGTLLWWLDSRTPRSQAHDRYANTND